MNDPKVGDVIAIPSGAGFGIAKVLYASKYFRNVILLKLYHIAFHEEMPELGSEIPADLYYTSSEPIKSGRWKIIGFQSASDTERLMSKRTVAGDVWDGDECLGVASEHELETLPKMQTYGYKLIEKAVSRLPISDRE
ncbi:hypothetical protein [Duganella callida]|uniref:Uncharacterized protein n=1 Tax=Duganella callida TaxID=2561932 RepID=A0A4Y9SK44_9BURK|nr:hypothetical protein [Duganella callida]TFW27000.1 hypothetical protein E4L98_08055 [Duganella callida]